MSKTILKNANTRYMNVTEFKDRAELPTLEEAIKGETISNKMDSEDNKNLPQNNKGQGNKIVQIVTPITIEMIIGVGSVITKIIRI